MWNVFIIFRFILFSLIIFMNVLDLIFASWNVGASVSAGISAPGASAFLILISIVLFLFIAAALAELVSPSVKTANITFECGWTAIFSVMQLGAAVAATVTGPPVFCHPAAPSAVCASSQLLVPVSWLCSFIMLAYFFMLFGTTIAHVRLSPLIWWKSIYSVPWFSAPETITNAENQQSTSHPSNHVNNSTRNSFIVFRFDHDGQLTRPDDEESRIPEPILFPERSNGLQPPALPMSRRKSIRPSWAKKTSGRRGLDSPFGIKSNSSSESGSHSPYVGANSNSAMPKRQMRRGIDQPFARKVDNAAVPLPTAQPRDGFQVPHVDVRPLTPVQRKRSVSPVFSEKVYDQDSPIPLPQRSEWIQAYSPRSVIPSRAKGR